MSDEAGRALPEAAMKVQITGNALAVRELSQAIRCLAVVQLDMLKGDRQGAHTVLEQIAGYLSKAAAYLDEATETALETQRTGVDHLDDTASPRTGSAVCKLAIDLSIAAGDRAASLTDDVRIMQAQQDEVNGRIDVLGRRLDAMAADRPTRC